MVTSIGTSTSTDTGTGTTGRVARSRPRYHTTYSTGTVQSDLNLDKSNLGARVGCNKTDPLLLDWLSLAPTVCHRATGDAALGSRIGPDGKIVRGKSMSD